MFASPLLAGLVGLATLHCEPAALSRALAGEHARLERLVAAYPEHLLRIDGGHLMWRDGTRMAIDDGSGSKPHAAWLSDPDIEDMLAIPYRPGDLGLPPPYESDPGRARPARFFEKMYGDCRKGEVAPNLVDVVWLPRKSGQKIRVTRVNGVAERLAAASQELDTLPARFDRFLKPSAGTYVCRPIAGTSRISGHGYGIAIDIAIEPSHYWRWAKPDATGRYPYRNAIPIEIVRIFESHGFIWGGKWYHYDTMHFEYRPELLPPSTAAKYP